MRRATVAFIWVTEDGRRDLDTSARPGPAGSFIHGPAVNVVVVGGGGGKKFPAKRPIPSTGGIEYVYGSRRFYSDAAMHAGTAALARPGSRCDRP